MIVVPFRLAVLAACVLCADAVVLLNVLGCRLTY